MSTVYYTSISSISDELRKELLADSKVQAMRCRNEFRLKMRRRPNYFAMESSEKSRYLWPAGLYGKSGGCFARE